MNPEEQNVATGEPQVTPSNVTVTENPSGGMTATVDKPNVNPMEPQGDQGQQQEPQQQQQTPDMVSQVQDDVSNTLKAESDLLADLKAKGVDFDALADEYDRNGALSQESLDKLARAGYPKSVVDAYINGMEASADRYVQQIQSFAGGEDNFARLQQYMSTRPAGEVRAFNQLIESGNLGQIQLAIQGIQAQMNKQYGTANPTVMGNGAARSTPNGYTSTAQMIKDMSDPRYQKDINFTQEVMRKIQASSIF